MKDDLGVGECVTKCGRGEKEHDDDDVGEEEQDDNDGDEEVDGEDVQDEWEVAENEDDEVDAEPAGTGEALVVVLKDAGMRIVFWWNVPLMDSES